MTCSCIQHTHTHTHTLYIHTALNEAPPTAAPIQECDCPTVDPRAISSETLLIIIVFVIFFIIIGAVVVVATVACLCFYYHNKNASVVMRQSSLEGRYHDEDIDSKSHSRSASQSSYSSDGSHSSSSGGEEEENGQSVDSKEVHHRCKDETGQFVREISSEDVLLKRSQRGGKTVSAFFLHEVRLSLHSVFNFFSIINSALQQRCTRC